MDGALGLPRPSRLLASAISRVRQWPVESQLQARRNAMVATTAATRRRVEREDVASYLAARAGRPEPAATPTASALPAVPAPRAGTS